MSRLALGTVQFGLHYGIANSDGQVSDAQMTAMLRLAREHGVNMLDTAVAYGESEFRLGEAGVKDFKIVTKLPELPDSCDDAGVWVKQQIRESLARMGVASVYGVLLHKPEQLMGDMGVALYRALMNLKDSGYVQKFGISIYAPSELTQLIADFQVDIVQAPFNLIDQRLHSSGWLQRLKDKQVEIHTRSVFLQGLLLMGKEKIPAKFNQWNKLWGQWQSWIDASNISAVEACLNFPLSFPEIDKVVVGADSQEQLAKILKASNTVAKINLPNLSCDDENLINPGKWSSL